MKITTILILVCAAFVFNAEAQSVNDDVCRNAKNMEYSMFSPSYHIYYGCGYYASGKFPDAAREFETGAKQFSDNAALFYHLGSAYAAAAAKNPNAAEREALMEKARAAFDRAARLDASLRSKIPAVMAEETGEETDEETDADESVVGETGQKVPSIGEMVEVEAIPEKWVRGKVTRIVGGLPCPVVEVEHDTYGNGELRKLNFFCQSFRPLTNSTNQKTTPQKQGGGLTLGEYGCSSKVWNGGRWVFTPRGSFRLQANNKYTQTNGGGGYRYDSGTKSITFAGGFFGNSGAKGKVISSEQVDIEFTDSLWWTCALQK